MEEERPVIKLSMLPLKSWIETYAISQTVYRAVGDGNCDKGFTYIKAMIDLHSVKKADCSDKRGKRTPRANPSRSR